MSEYLTTCIAYTANVIENVSSGWETVTADITTENAIIAVFSLDGMSMEKDGYGRILEARIDESAVTPARPTTMLYLLNADFASPCTVGSDFTPASQDDIDKIETSLLFHYDNYVSVGSATDFKMCWTRSSKATKSLIYKTIETSRSMIGVLVLAASGVTISAGNSYSVKLKVQKDT